MANSKQLFVQTLRNRDAELQRDFDEHIKNAKALRAEQADIKKLVQRYNEEQEGATNSRSLFRQSLLTRSTELEGQTAQQVNRAEALIAERKEIWNLLSMYQDAQPTNDLSATKDDQANRTNSDSTAIDAQIGKNVAAAQMSPKGTTTNIKFKHETPIIDLESDSEDGHVPGAARNVLQTTSQHQVPNSSQPGPTHNPPQSIPVPPLKPFDAALAEKQIYGDSISLYKTRAPLSAFLVPNHPFPLQTDTLHPEFPTCVKINGRWVEIVCKRCYTNIRLDGEWLQGSVGINQHYHASHKDDPDIKGKERVVTHRERVMDEVDVARIRRGLQAATLIVVRPRLDDVKKGILQMRAVKQKGESGE